MELSEFVMCVTVMNVKLLLQISMRTQRKINYAEGFLKEVYQELCCE